MPLAEIEKVTAWHLIRRRCLWAVVACLFSKGEGAPPHTGSEAGRHIWKFVIRLSRGLSQPLILLGAVVYAGQPKLSSLSQLDLRSNMSNTNATASCFVTVGQVTVAWHDAVVPLVV